MAAFDAVQGDLEQQMGTLRLAEPSEIPDSLEYSHEQAGHGFSLGPGDRALSDSSSTGTDPGDELQIAAEVDYSNDELSEGKVGLIQSTIRCDRTSKSIRCSRRLW